MRLVSAEEGKEDTSNSLQEYGGSGQLPKEVVLESSSPNVVYKPMLTLSSGKILVWEKSVGKKEALKGLCGIETAITEKLNGTENGMKMGRKTGLQKHDWIPSKRELQERQCRSSAAIRGDSAGCVQSAS